MPRYVILEHDWPHRHWDLMLEAGGVLRTWRLNGPPRPGSAVTAERVGDHRLAYLDYEGPVSGGRGSVKRFDAGTFEWSDDTPQRVAVAVSGTTLTGRLELRGGPEGWACTFA
jgi:hypothetical protein